MDNIIPFGKYKGRSVEEVLIDDPQYLQWLSAQPDFRERHVALYQVIINRGAEPEETPEHNALQVLFLEDDFCAAFMDVVVPQWRDPVTLAEISAKEVSNIKNMVSKRLNDLGSSLKLQLINDTRTRREFEQWKAVEDIPSALTFEPCLKRTFEDNGIDVVLSVDIHSREKLPRYYNNYTNTVECERVYGGDNIINIEIKPVVGDDYPAVLRQCKRLMSRFDHPILFLERYTGVGATEKQFIATFALDHIKVVFKRDVDAAMAALASHKE
jgi:hypothetical protein